MPIGTIGYLPTNMDATVTRDVTVNATVAKEGIIMAVADTIGMEDTVTIVDHTVANFTLADFIIEDTTIVEDIE